VCPRALLLLPWHSDCSLLLQVATLKMLAIFTVASAARIDLDTGQPNFSSDIILCFLDMVITDFGQLTL
jgi:hypothetical protein